MLFTRSARRLCLVLALPLALAAATYPDPAQRVLTHREQNELITPRILRRFETVLPELMTREGIDMWIIPTRENNEDPVFRSMAPITYFASRRRTILVFFNPGGGKPVERYSIGRFDYDRLFTPVPTANDAQYEGLRQLVDEKKPRVIGINESDAWNHADGITANEKRRLLAALGPDHSARVKSAEYLAVGWLEVKTPEELEAYRHVMAVAHGIIREAFSTRVITPGKTTAQDVAWWMRQRVAEKGLGSWFQPSITIWRQGANVAAIQATPILPGDMLHTDFGIVYLGFCTDTQHNAYILKPGETDAPAGLKAGLAAANRLQDLTMKAARIGRTGNQALAEALAAAKAEGLVPSIYCHAIGYHGHAAGSPIGMADNQQGIPVRGDYAFRPNTWDSIELNVTHTVPEWGNMAVRFALEEDAALLPDGQWDWIAPRQTEFHLVPSEITPAAKPTAPALGSSQPAIRPRPVLQKKVVRTDTTPVATASGLAKFDSVEADAKWSNFSVYLRGMIETIEARWSRNLQAGSIFPPPKTSVTVRFRLNSLGEVVAILDVKNTTTEPGKEACVTAIKGPAPFGKWTNEMVATLGDSQDLGFTFHYR